MNKKVHLTVSFSVNLKQHFVVFMPPDDSFKTLFMIPWRVTGRMAPLLLSTRLEWYNARLSFKGRGKKKLQSTDVRVMFL